MQVMAFKASHVPGTVQGAQGLRCGGDSLGSGRVHNPGRKTVQGVGRATALKSLRPGSTSALWPFLAV